MNALPHHIIDAPAAIEFAVASAGLELVSSLA